MPRNDHQVRWWGRQEKKESKNFFFKKKKQKTFINLGLGRLKHRGQKESKVFCCFFLKKKCLLFCFPNSKG
jgi:hypothetical protein